MGLQFHTIDTLKLHSALCDERCTAFFLLKHFRQCAQTAHLKAEDANQ